MTDTAKRNNAGKLDLTFIPIDAQEHEARVWTKGAEKYGRNQWEKLWGDKTPEVVAASLMRHLYDILKGNHRDAETGELNAAAIRCNAAMLIRYALELEAKETR